MYLNRRNVMETSALTVIKTYLIVSCSLKASLCVCFTDICSVCIVACTSLYCQNILGLSTFLASSYYVISVTV